MIALLRHRLLAGLVFGPLFVGAMVAGSRPLRAQTSAAPARVQGIVFDSLGNRPLGGATVQVLESPPGRSSYAAVTDSLGRFQIDSVRPGSYLAGFLHPLLDSIGVVAPYDSIEVHAGATASVALAVPSGRRIAGAICGENRAKDKAGRAGSADSVGMIVGHVRDAGTGAPMP